ncbi:MAG: HEAT repeat domain-containing protein [Candidatus Latescibacterota bacterium]|nr:HEAT repeat domain-containing protein [Candidatus Latescibacterota bacterium]
MSGLLRILNLRRNETAKVSLAALVFFFVAVDDGIVKSVSSGVFNIRVGPQRLPEMYSWIAVLFSATMVGLSYLTTKVRRRRLVFALFSAVAGVLALNTVALWASEHVSGASGAGLYAFLFISSEIIRNIAGFQVWIVAGGICYTSRAKVLFPLLAASTTVGDVFGGLLVRAFGGVFEPYQIYGLAVFNTIVVIMLLRPLFRRYFVAPNGEGDGEGEAVSLGENLRLFLGSTYLRLLFLLSLVLFALYTAIHYGLSVVARGYYPKEGDLTAFFGLFFAFAGVATLLTTTLLLRHILRWLGVGNIYLWVCLVHAAIAGMLAVLFSYTLPPTLVVAVFAFNVLNYVLLDSIIAPTYQVLMTLVPERNSDGTRMIMEGGFMLLGGLLGAGITSAHAQGALDLNQFFLLLLGISSLMALAGSGLKRSYREVLIQAVRDQNFDVEDEQAMASLKDVISHSVEFPRSLILHNDDGVRQMGIEILRQNPAAAASVCLPLLGHENSRLRGAALQALRGSDLQVEEFRTILGLLDDDDSEVRLHAARVVSAVIEDPASRESLATETQVQILKSVSPRLVPDADNPALQTEFLFILDVLGDEASQAARAPMVEDLLNSEVEEDLTAGIEVVIRLGTTRSYEQIPALLEHNHPVVREAAVKGLAQRDDADACALLVDTLDDPDPDVVSATKKALAAGAANYREYMVSATDAASRRQWEGLILALTESENGQTSAERIVASCRERLLQANRYLVVAEQLERDQLGSSGGLLRDQLELECQTVRDVVIALLGELGDVEVVADLVQRMNEDNPGARENAIELLQNIGDRELMEPLLPLLTDDREESLSEALRLSEWHDRSPALPEAIVHVLRTRDPWTQLAAAWAAVSMGRADLIKELREHSEHTKEIEEMTQATDRDDSKEPLTNIEKITFLKESSFFAALPLEELYHVALSVQEEAVRSGTTVIEQGSLGDKMYIVIDGRLEVRVFGDTEGDTGQQVAQLEDRQVFGDMALLDDEPRSASVIALEECRLLSLQRSDLERILRRYSSIAFSMMRMLSQRLREAQAA